MTDRSTSRHPGIDPPPRYVFVSSFILALPEECSTLQPYTILTTTSRVEPLLFHYLRNRTAEKDSGVRTPLVAEFDMIGTRWAVSSANVFQEDLPCQQLRCHGGNSSWLAAW